MGAINLRDIEDGLLEEISRLANANHHSLEEEAVKLLRDGLRARGRRREWIDRFNEIAAMTPKGVKQTDSVELLREDRDR